jgi:hypothetical protein
VVVAASVVVLILALSIWYADGGGNPAVSVNISGGYISPSYTGSANDYLSGTVSCPASVNGGATFTCEVTLASTAPGPSHHIDGLGAEAPFGYHHCSPSLPYTLSPSQSALFAVTLTAPSSGGTYPLTITVSTD